MQFLQKKQTSIYYSVAKFSDYIAVAIAGEDFMTLKNIRMIEFFEDLYLGEEKFLQLSAFERIELYYFDGDCLAYV